MIIDRIPACGRIPPGGSIAAAVAALSCGDSADDPSLVHRWPCGCNGIAAVRKGRIRTHGRSSVRTASGSET